MPTTPDAGSPPRLVVFSDLDGTLLTQETYDWSPAREAVAELARRGVPLILASSKTRVEIETWRDRLGNHDPFISENGGALFVPRSAAMDPIPDAVTIGEYSCVELGTRYRELRVALRRLERDLGVDLKGFGDLGRDEVGRLTGLSGEDLERSLQREYDEPFVTARPLTEAEEVRVASDAAALGLQVVRGGRFHHLTGANSKGRAARILLERYGAGGKRVVSLALGDGPNDLELLREVDHPVVVARPDGSHDPDLRRALPRARFTRGSGPVGFAEAVLEHLAGVRAGAPDQG